MPPTSSDGKYYKSVYYNKLTVSLLDKLHRTVWGVPPASSNGKYYKLVYYNKLIVSLHLLYKLHWTVWGVPPASSDGKYYKLVYYNKFNVSLHLLIFQSLMSCADMSIRKISLILMLLLMFDVFTIERWLTIVSDLRDSETFLDFSQTLLRNDSCIKRASHWMLHWTSLACI